MLLMMDYSEQQLLLMKQTWITQNNNIADEATSGLLRTTILLMKQNLGYSEQQYC